MTLICQIKLYIEIEVTCLGMVKTLQIDVYRYYENHGLIFLQPCNSYVSYIVSNDSGVMMSYDWLLKSQSQGIVML